MRGYSAVLPKLIQFEMIGSDVWHWFFSGQKVSKIFSSEGTKLFVGCGGEKNVRIPDEYGFGGGIRHIPSPQVFLVLLPLLFGPTTSKFLQMDTQSSSAFHSRCPNHLSRPRLTTSATPSTPNRSFNSLLDILFLRLIPHI